MPRPAPRPMRRPPYNPEAIDISAALRAENYERWRKAQAHEPIADPAERRVLIALGTLMVIVVLVAWSIWGR